MGRTTTPGLVQASLQAAPTTTFVRYFFRRPPQSSPCGPCLSLRAVFSNSLATNSTIAGATQASRPHRKSQPLHRPTPLPPSRLQKIFPRPFPVKVPDSTSARHAFPQLVFSDHDHHLFLASASRIPQIHADEREEKNTVRRKDRKRFAATSPDLCRGKSYERKCVETTLDILCQI